MAVARNGEWDIYYEEFGDPAHPVLLLVNGLGSQSINYADDWCRMFAAEGFRVVRYDNRDVGLSSHRPDAHYTCDDMAGDGMAVLDALGVQRAHVMGLSMGGMIVQMMAIEFADRLRSMTSSMSMTGDPNYGQAAPEAMAALLAAPPTERAAYIESAQNWTIWASKKYANLAEMRDRAGRDFDRSFYPEGSARQLAAIFAVGDRTDRLRSVKVPTLVIHGRDDTLITPSGGMRTAEVIDGAHLLLLADMGHDLPKQLYPVVFDTMAAHMGWADAGA